MTHFYRRSKIDGNQPDIVRALRAAGASVLSLAALGDGAPDLLVSHLGTMLLLEVKMPREKLRPAQVTWQAHWDPYCPVHVVESVADALLVLRDCGTKGVHEAQLHAR